jgi:hypothetical protein
MVIFVNESDVAAFCRSAAADDGVEENGCKARFSPERGSTAGGMYHNHVDWRFVACPTDSAEEPVAAHALRQLRNQLGRHHTTLWTPEETVALSKQEEEEGEELRGMQCSGAALTSDHRIVKRTRAFLCTRSSGAVDGAAVPPPECESEVFLWATDIPLDQNGRFSSCASGSPAASFLCLDVGGYYSVVPAPPTSSVAQHTQSSKPSRPKGQRLLKQQRALSDPSAGRREEDLRAASSLDAKLQQRFSSAQETFPFSIAVMHEFTLTEVWVVPLPSRNVPHRVDNCGSPLDYFPCFVAVGGVPQRVRGASAPAQAWPQAAPQVRARVRQHPPQWTLHLAQGSSGPTAGQRKRRRAEEENKGETAQTQHVHTLTLEAPENAEISELHCRVPENSPARLRVIEASFLTHSCYFAQWCCVDDFDVTHTYSGGNAQDNPVKGSGVGRHVPGEVETLRQRSASYHVFYAALRRSFTREEALLHRCWEVVWGGDHVADKNESRSTAAWLTAETLLDYGQRESCRQRQSWADVATAAPAADSENDWFKEAESCAPASSAAHGRDGDGCAGNDVWTIKTLWGLWTRLGWMPPHESNACASLWVRLCDGAAAPSSSAPHRNCTSVRCLTPAEWMAYVIRFNDVVDDAYIQQMLRDADAKDSREAGEDADEESEQCDGVSCDSMECCALPGHTTPLPQLKQEGLDTLHRNSSMRVALFCRKPSWADFNGDDGAWGECAPLTASDEQRAGAAMSYVGSAAQALAADIAATTPETCTSFGDDDGGGASVPGVFSDAWARGVLESPAVLIPSAPSATSSLLALQDGFVIHDPSVVNALLRQRPCCPREKPDVSNSGNRIAAGSPEHVLSLEETFCEAADIAELRWRTPSDSLRCRFPPDKSHCVKDGSGHDGAARCTCCCSSACGAQAAAVRRRWRDASVLGSAATALDNVDPLAAFLSTSFAAYAASNGVQLCHPSALTPDPTTPSFAPPEEAKEKQGVGVGRSCDTKSPETVIPTGEALTAALTDTIVRVVQQNKAVVRRLMRLVASYAKTSGAGAVDVAEEAAGEGDRETLAGGVLRCLTGGKNNGFTLAEDENAMAARNLALRQLRGFWTNVAVLTRQSTREKYGALFSDPTKKTTTFREDKDRPTVNEVAQADGEGSRAAATVESECSVVAEEVPPNTVGGTLADGVNAAASPVVVGPCATLAPHQRCLSSAKANSIEEDRHQREVAAFKAVVNELNGTQAMQLYMRHVLRCTSCSSTASPVRCDAKSGAVQAEAQFSLAASAKNANSAERRSATPSFAELLRPHLWLQHALFILSYGRAGLMEGLNGAAKTATQSETALSLHRRAQAATDVAAEAVSFASPCMTAFRVLRSGKLTLDAWIVAVLEEYAGRWRRAVQRHASA